ncbi:uncharacterized protein BX663DRAFT_482057 [Cokeromyces recurvatus]|uniref:uncharacterized protein n=1 Tax=Cokeromyces recurvatus TaxID=90255 RepID=UPI00221FE790|nr:uncharacterized protein BX663DRAFT_482057 [Cokeromyces recurvatus]KAI7907780.1 hypothetical protein BX663DRAFT_482057 [Cokeromyces recurvatus]
MSTEVLSNAVNTIDLLQSIYFDKEFEFRRLEDEKLYLKIQACHEKDEWSSLSKESLPNHIEFILKAPIDNTTMHLVFNGRISLIPHIDDQLTLTSASNPWLSREDHEILNRILNDDQNKVDSTTWIIEKLQHMQSAAEPYALLWLQKSKQNTMNKANGDNEPVVRFLRDWIWFPMIYTREKRGHIIHWAPRYNITGFLCPGKPGCMCLEGTEEDVTTFVNDIKTISWADIPASHRKMTSRWKQSSECKSHAEIDSQRLFSSMTEVKFDIHGTFANHNDLNKLQSWLQEKGCGEAFKHLFEYDHK